MGLPLPEVEPCWWENGMIASPPSALNMGALGDLSVELCNAAIGAPLQGVGSTWWVYGFQIHPAVSTKVGLCYLLRFLNM